MKKAIYFLKQQVGDIKKITASYDGISATFQRAGDKRRCSITGRGNVRQIKHLLREFIKSTQAVDG
ncbi:MULTISPECIES: hypothetical protein [Klebsiella pneumoniae complex]|uniref:hypothetical protein n=1 Tax=Klebsiella pneumoniae complex TaxID=3390273 RepID=UPI000E3CD9B8|nr:MULTISPECIES: hypothetical protein [Klebsiella]MEA8727280.1 hypothetical protein [Klebsiella pneumoniae]UWS42660.1 hypothetical protein N1F85_17225 [Klebsiella variicola]HBW9911403.1 hypothetical protein [Klebsiella pneumoniae]HDT6494580.1 hypothetical protein [Klebsiella pneumoniae]HDY6828519.1 hypothetical protein [Klebsiella pneumoniae]